MFCSSDWGWLPSMKIMSADAGTLVSASGNIAANNVRFIISPGLDHNAQRGRESLSTIQATGVSH
jgi:hypothetical protein